MSFRRQLTWQVILRWGSIVSRSFFSQSICIHTIIVKIPPRVMFLTQVWGTLLGCIVNYAVMISIVTERREVLLDPQGTNVWSGQTVQVYSSGHIMCSISHGNSQSLNSKAVTWSLASQEFSVHSQYFWVPMALLLGTIPTTIQYLIWRVSIF
jgi:hypothetical protein